MKKLKKKIKQKLAHKSPAKKQEKQEKQLPEEIGFYHDFLIFDDSINDPNIKDYLLSQNSSSKIKSRFSTLFDEIIDNNKNNNNKSNKDEIKDEIKENIKDDIKDDIKDVIKEDNNDEIKENIKEDSSKNNKSSNDDNKEDSKDEIKDYINDYIKDYITDSDDIIEDNINKEDNKKEDVNNINNNIINDNNEVNNNKNKVDINKDIGNKDFNNFLINNNNIINENKIENDKNINLNNINNDNDGKFKNFSINTINSDQNYSESLTKTTTLESKQLFSELNLSELSFSFSNLNLNFPITNPPYEQNNNLFNPYHKQSIFSNYSGPHKKKSIYSNYSGPHKYQSNKFSITDLNYSNSLKSNYSIYERNSSAGQRLSEKKYDLTVDIKKIIFFEDKRTTVMIKNIPNKFTRELLLKIIDQNFKKAYDLFILPTDVNGFRNFGYAFINFTYSYYIPYFYLLFNGKKWGSTNSKKICEITYSNIQGRNNLLSHYSDKIIFHNEESKKYDADLKFIIPNDYKNIFKEAFPNIKVEEYKYYFVTKMPFN